MIITTIVVSMSAFLNANVKNAEKYAKGNIIKERRKHDTLC